MIGGMLPLALGIGEGGETQAPMGRAIIGGVITSTLLTLVVVPVLYSYLVQWGERLRARRAARAASAVAAAHVAAAVHAPAPAAVSEVVTPANAASTAAAAE